MSDVRIRDGAIEVGGERISFLSGEVHYWRLNPSAWPVVLDRVREIGLGMVATYVPWEYHELRPGEFDFDGRTEAPRNLRGFLKLAGEKGLRVFIRPGPYIYAEWRNAGVPDRVVGLPRLSEEYRAEARVWMRAVVEAIGPYMEDTGWKPAPLPDKHSNTGLKPVPPPDKHSNTGLKPVPLPDKQSNTGWKPVPLPRPVVLFQPDNEMDVFTHWFEARCGLGDPRQVAQWMGDGGFFQRFLGERYGGDIAALNEAWGSAYGRFEEAQACAEPVEAHEPRARQRAVDYWNFQHWATRESLSWHIEEYRRLGVKLPMIANYYPGGDVQNWREVARAGAEAIGVDWYPKNEFGKDRAERAKEHRLFLDTCRLQSTYSALPCIPELQCGVWHGYHEHVGLLTPGHYRLMAVSALLAGIKGLNWYMLAGRDNWYYSAINERGEWRGEIAEVLMGIHRAWREIDPPTLTRRVSCGVWFDPGQIGPENKLNENPVLTALHEAAVDHSFADPVQDGPGAQRVMFYAGADWLAAGAQRRMVEHMEAGGTLVVFRGGPRLDERMRALDLVGVRGPDRVLSKLGKKVEVRPAWVDGARAGVAEGSVWVWDRPPGEAIVGEQVAGSQQAVECADAWMRAYIGQRWVCGYREARGKGALIVLGLAPSASLVRAVLDWCGAGPASEAELPGVHTAVFDRPDGVVVLMAANLNTGPARMRVMVRGLRGRVRVEDAFEGGTETCEGESLSVKLAGLGAGVWTIRAEA